MTIEVKFLENKKLKACFNDFEVLTDQPLDNDGENSAPSPFDYFLVSTALCAAYYVRIFCEKRGFDHNRIKVIQDFSVLDEDPSRRKIIINLEVPEDFPEKYYRALKASVNSCSVKKLVQNQPIFETRITL